MILGFWADHIVPVKEAFSVRIHDKDGLVERVNQNGIRGLRADAVDLQKFVPQMGEFLPSHRLEIPMIFIKKEPHKILQPAGFDVEISGGFNVRGELRNGNIAQGALLKNPRGS